MGSKSKGITICSIKRKEKSFFFLSDMKFCFMKRLFYTALEENMSVARSESGEKKSAVVCVIVLYLGLIVMLQNMFTLVSS
jgi:hypothetical protein